MESRLTKAGLTRNEAKVYYELLTKGSLSAHMLSKKISMDRTLTYTVLNHLIEKGLVTYVIKENKKYFEASDPENLLHPLKKKEAYIKDLVPILKKVARVKDAAQEVNIFEGLEGLRTYANLMIQSRSFVAFGATGKMYDYLYEAPRIAKEMERKSYRAKIIFHPEYKNHPTIAYKGVEAKFLNIKSEATTTISGDYVGICVIKGKPWVMVIKSKEIAKTYREYFDVLWSAAQTY